MPYAANTPVITVHEAASMLGVSLELLRAWNMVVIHCINGYEVVPVWSADPKIARYMPTLSQVFQGEALSYSLWHIRPLNDGRNGLEALRCGHWREVLDELKALRARFDNAMDIADEVIPARPVTYPKARAMLH